MPLRIGLFRHKVTIESRTTDTVDAAGQVTGTWTTYATAYARIRPLNGRELFFNQHTYPEANFMVEMRHIAGVKAAMRVRFGSRLFNIQHVGNPDERGVKLELLCREEF